jgi:CheY-like chemotaxis protein
MVAYHTILIAEDERIIALDIESMLKDLGCSVIVTDSGEDAVRKSEELHPDLVLMDIRLRGRMDGLTAAEQIQHRFGIPVVYVTAFSDVRAMKMLNQTSSFRYITKPFERFELQRVIETVDS